MAATPLCAFKLGPIGCFCVQQTPPDLAEIRPSDDLDTLAEAQRRRKVAALKETQLPAPESALKKTPAVSSGAGLAMSDDRAPARQSVAFMPMNLGDDDSPSQLAASASTGFAIASQAAAASADSEEAGAPVGSTAAVASGAAAAATAAVASASAAASKDLGPLPVPSAAASSAAAATSSSKALASAGTDAGAAEAEEAPVQQVPNKPLDFVNVMVEKLWPSIDRAVYKAVRETVLPIVKDTIGSMGVPFVGKKLKIISFSLGDKPAKVGPVNVVTLPSPSGKGTGALELRIGIELDCDTDISFGFSQRLCLGIEKLSIVGTFVVRLAPLVPMIPAIGAVTMYFLDPPDVKLSYTGIGKIAEVPKISDIVRSSVDQAIAGSMVLPNVIPTPLMGEEQGVDRKELLAAPLGVLIITAIRAENLVGKQGQQCMFGHVCDPYIEITCSDDVWHSATIEKTVNPVWTKYDQHGFFVYDMDQRIKIEVFDDEPGPTDNNILIGARSLSIYEAMRSSEQGLDLLRDGSPQSRGKLFLGFQWCSLTPNSLGECADVIVHCKFDEACIPAILFQKKRETIKIRAKINNIGSRRRGRKKVEHVVKDTGFVTVYDQVQAMKATAQHLFEMAERAEDQKLAAQTISSITRLTPEMLKSHAIDEEAQALLEDEANRIFDIEAVLSMPIPRDAVSDAEIELQVLDGDMMLLGTFTVPMREVVKEMIWRGPADGHAIFKCAHVNRVGPLRQRHRVESLKVRTTLTVEGLQVSNPARSRSKTLAACDLLPESRGTLVDSGVRVESAVPGIRVALAETSPKDDEMIMALVAQLWPTLDKAIKHMFEDQIMQTIKDSLPPALRGIKLNSFTLGSKPPELGPIRVFPGPRGTGQLELRIGVCFLSDEISIHLGVLGGFAPVGVTGIHFQGELVVRLQPILDMVPVLGGIVIFFLDPPFVRLKFSGLAKAAEIVRVKGLVRTAINSAIANALVLPHVIALPLYFDEEVVDLKRLQSPTPRGVLRVTVQSAKDLRGMDWGPTKSTSDPYVVIMLGSDRLQTETVHRTCDPVWKKKNTRDFLVYDEGQKLLIEVYDYDFFTPDDVIGSVLPMKSVAEAVQLTEEGKPFPLKVTDMLGQLPELPDADKEASGGELMMQCQWLQLMPGKVGNEGLLVLVEVDEVMLPEILGPGAALCAEIGGQKKTTPAAYPQGGSVAKAVEEEMERAAERCKSIDLNPTMTAEITSLPEEKVRALYGVNKAMSEAEKEESAKRVKKLATKTLHIESRLYLTLESKDPTTEIHLSLVDPAGKRLVGTSFTLGELRSEPGLKKRVRRMSSEEFARVKVEVDVTAVGMQFAELVAP